MELFARAESLHGQRAVLRSGYLPEPEALMATRRIAVRVPK